MNVNRPGTPDSGLKRQMSKLVPKGIRSRSNSLINSVNGSAKKQESAATPEANTTTASDNESINSQSSGVMRSMSKKMKNPFKRGTKDDASPERNGDTGDAGVRSRPSISRGARPLSFVGDAKDAAKKVFKKNRKSTADGATSEVEGSPKPTPLSLDESIAPTTVVTAEPQEVTIPQPVSESPAAAEEGAFDLTSPAETTFPTTIDVTPGEATDKRQDAVRDGPEEAAKEPAEVEAISSAITTDALPTTSEPQLTEVVTQVIEGKSSAEVVQEADVSILPVAAAPEREAGVSFASGELAANADDIGLRRRAASPSGSLSIRPTSQFVQTQVRVQANSWLAVPRVVIGRVVQAFGNAGAFVLSFCVSIKNAALAVVGVKTS